MVPAAIANRVVTRLFVAGNGARADQLVLFRNSLDMNSGGWGLIGVRKVILDEIRAEMKADRIRERRAKERRLGRIAKTTREIRT